MIKKFDKEKVIDQIGNDNGVNQESHSVFSNFKNEPKVEDPIGNIDIQ